MLLQKLFQMNATSEVSWSHCEKNHQLRVLTRQLTRLIHMLYKLYCFKLATLLWKKFHEFSCMYFFFFRRYLTQKHKRVSKMNLFFSPSFDFSSKNMRVFIPKYVKLFSNECPINLWISYRIVASRSTSRLVTPPCY